MLELQITIVLFLFSLGQGLPLPRLENITLLQDWMTNLPTEVTKRSLSMLAIPGTHDSGSYAITPNSPISPDMKFGVLLAIFRLFIDIQQEEWSVTQRADLKQQLQAGIRYLDLRVARQYSHLSSEEAGSISTNYEESFRLVHGQYANRVKDELEQVKQFLLQHPQEVVILDFQHFHQFLALDHFIFELMLKRIFKGMLMPYKREIEKIPSLAEMWLDKKQVIALGMSRNSLWVGGLVWPRSAINQPWANTFNPSVLADFLQQAYKNRTENVDSKQFFVYQGVLSPGMVEYIFPTADKGLPALAKRAHPVVADFLQNVSDPCGIIITDFAISLFPEFVHKVVALNY